MHNTYRRERFLSLHLYKIHICSSGTQNNKCGLVHRVDPNAEEVGRLAQVFCRQAKRDRFYQDTDVKNGNILSIIEKGRFE
jgi:hypothetical protein